jgi:hypothetical protein
VLPDVLDHLMRFGVVVCREGHSLAMAVSLVGKSSMEKIERNDKFKSRNAIQTLEVWEPKVEAKKVVLGEGGAQLPN